MDLHGRPGSIPAGLWIYTMVEQVKFATEVFPASFFHLFGFQTS